MPSLQSFASLVAATALLKLVDAASECDAACVLATGLISCGSAFDCNNNVRSGALKGFSYSLGKFVMFSFLLSRLPRQFSWIYRPFEGIHRFSSNFFSRLVCRA